MIVEGIRTKDYFLYTWKKKKPWNSCTNNTLQFQKCNYFKIWNKFPYKSLFWNKAEGHCLCACTSYKGWEARERGTVGARLAHWREEGDSQVRKSPLWDAAYFSAGLDAELGENGRDHLAK